MPKRNGFTPIIVLVVILLVVGGIWLGISKVRQNQNINPVSSPVPTVDTSNWKTYTNENYNFLFKYPNDWKKSANDSDSLLLITKDLSRLDIICDDSNDCMPLARISLSVKNITQDYKDTSPCSFFGECQFAEKQETSINGEAKIQMEYLRKDSVYPIFTYVTLRNKYVIEVKSYLPSTKNCVGCPELEDPVAIQDVGREIVNILSTFKSTNEK